ncbi:hypothetical protein J4732_20065 [Serratia marcescens]|uniref:Uncharacterized protein n=1 Tax=Serratia marcescens TaxID=615 RepID=A0A939NMW0_SERMA|nr:hypothetical protein [Serratia marcescens]
MSTCCRWWWPAVCASRCRSCSASSVEVKAHVGGGADADRRRLRLCADGAGIGGFIAFSIADRPGLTPGLIGGML